MNKSGKRAPKKKDKGLSLIHISLGLTLAPETLGEFGGWLFWLTPAGVLLCYLWNAILTSLIMGFGPKMRRLMT